MSTSTAEQATNTQTTTIHATLSDGGRTTVPIRGYCASPDPEGNLANKITPLLFAEVRQYSARIATFVLEKVNDKWRRAIDPAGEYAADVDRVVYRIPCAKEDTPCAVWYFPIDDIAKHVPWLEVLFGVKIHALQPGEAAVVQPGRTAFFESGAAGKQIVIIGNSGCTECACLFRAMRPMPPIIKMNLGGVNFDWPMPPDWRTAFPGFTTFKLHPDFQPGDRTKAKLDELTKFLGSSWYVETCCYDAFPEGWNLGRFSIQDQRLSRLPAQLEREPTCRGSWHGIACRHTTYMCDPSKWTHIDNFNTPASRLVQRLMLKREHAIQAGAIMVYAGRLSGSFEYSRQGRAFELCFLPQQVGSDMTLAFAGADYDCLRKIAFAIFGASPAEDNDRPMPNEFHIETYAYGVQIVVPYYDGQDVRVICLRNVPENMPDSMVADPWKFGLVYEWYPEFGSVFWHSHNNPHLSLAPWSMSTTEDEEMMIQTVSFEERCRIPERYRQGVEALTLECGQQPLRLPVYVLTAPNSATDISSFSIRLPSLVTPQPACDDCDLWGCPLNIGEGDEGHAYHPEEIIPMVHDIQMGIASS